MTKNFAQEGSLTNAVQTKERPPKTQTALPLNPFFGLQRTIGNQAVLRLLESGQIQGKLRVSQPGDADEQDADRIADQIVSAQHAPVVQRKCSCSSDASCSKCSHEEGEEVIHRQIAPPSLRSSALSIQRAPSGSSTPGADPTAQSSAASGPARGSLPARSLIVEDDSPSVTSTQMRKSQFLALLQTTACATADAVLASVGHTTKGCSYIKKWLDHYKDQDAQHLTRAMNKYAPEIKSAHTAYEAIALLNQRIQQAALSWANTGKVSGLPSDLQADVMGGGGGFLGAIAGFASSGFGSALLGFFGGGSKRESDGAGERGSLQRKAQNADGTDAGTHDAAAIRSQLGSGHSLDSRVQSQMSSAFGYDFSGVRVHTDSRPAGLSADLNARAFTIGNDVTFAAGEYQPGTLIGNALIAHELAHVVQQSAGHQPAMPMQKGSDSGQLEEDADHSAIGAMLSIWGGPRGAMKAIGTNAMPRLKSSLKLQRFSSCKMKEPPKQQAEAQQPKQPAEAQPLGFQEAIDAHKAQQTRVKKLLDDAKGVPSGQSSAYRVLQNSIEWVERGRFQLCILTPTHDARIRKPGQIAYFDDRVFYPAVDGTYDPTAKNDSGVNYREAGRLGEAPPIPVESRSSMKFFTVPLYFSKEPVTMEELSGALMHETQHMADRIEPSSKPVDIQGAERLYQTEFHSYWVQAPLQEQECIPGMFCHNKAPQDNPGQLRLPGSAGSSRGQDFGSEKTSATNFTVEGSTVKQPGECKRLFPGCGFETKRQVTNLANEKQERIFKHLLENYGDDLFDCSYVCSGAFKAMVDKMSGPVGVNLVNSIRIDALLDFADRCNPAMAPTSAPVEKALAAVDTLDDADREFLRSGLAKFPQELKEEEARKTEEAKEKKRLDLSGLMGQALQNTPEKHTAPVSFWLYLSRKLPMVVVKKIQQKIQSSRAVAKQK